jgi:signal transduction histidine kinase
MGHTVSESYHILIVDDDFEQVEMITLFLNFNGFQKVDSARDMESLWRHLATSQYDIILLDYMLPDGTGLQVLDGLSQRGHQIPVIMVTGLGNERIAVQAIQRGALDYLIKDRNYLETLPALIRKVVHDIADRKQMEHQYQANQLQLTQAARLATIGEMASGIAHQIYNPLTTIIADAQLLLHELPQDHTGRESAEAIEQAGWRLQSVVQRLLEFSRPATSNLEILAVNQTIEGAISLVGAHIEAAGVEIETRLETDLPMIQGNVRQLEDLWVNLLLLARDAAHAERAKKIRIRTKRADNNSLLVQVCDNGRPIPAHQIASIFEPDFTGLADGRGTGLELSICREIVRQHNGQIMATSLPEGETIISVSLPFMHPSSSE